MGTKSGEVQVWDVAATKCLRTFNTHKTRVGALNWCGRLLASGSKDRSVVVRDMRTPNSVTSFLAHRYVELPVCVSVLDGIRCSQEVCGLRWSSETNDPTALLASGGNDNRVFVWSMHNRNRPIHRFSDHTAAVKALDWSPHQTGLLATGGGTSDKCIRFWNTLNPAETAPLDLDCPDSTTPALSSYDTGSQVCNLMWSRTTNELVSTHGYSFNSVRLWHE